MRKGILVLRTARAAGVVLAWFVAASCSANSQDSEVGGGSGSGGTSSGTGGSGAGASGTGGSLFGDASVGDGDIEEAGACAGESFPGKLAPLDVYVLLDATASMNGANDTPVVWPSVTSALIGIASDPMSTGIGIGLTYLPTPPPPGFVVPGSCEPALGCGPLGTCRFLGAGYACDQACTTNDDCGLYGPCMPMLQYKICNGALVKNVSCDPADYGQPVVPIAELPGNKDAFVQAINNKDPDGDATPTQPSLAGTLIYAHQWAIDHPTRLVHVLFATDGLPNDCTFNSIDGAAEAAKTAFEGPPSVPTFVLGIGDLSDLNKIAQEGGTGQAYIANGSNVADTLVDVFNDIRANGACQFQIPQPPAGEVLDYDRVNVYYTPLGATEKEAVKYVGTEAQCDPTEGGWYYDDPSKANPTKILLCPATCEGVKLSEEGVEVILGCKTILK
jgi:hypothetical protein